MKNPRQVRSAMLILVLLSLVVRAFLAGFLEFGNDEVYYWTYALFPDVSHFDHPPMVGMLIQLTTLNLAFDSELMIRLGAVLLGTLKYMACLPDREKYPRRTDRPLCGIALYRIHLCIYHCRHFHTPRHAPADVLVAEHIFPASLDMRVS